MTTQIKILLENIQNWMLDNDYECGIRGSAIYDEITELLDSAAKNSIIDSTTL